jgi:Zn-dependent protease with chaperone function
MWRSLTSRRSFEAPRAFAKGARPGGRAPFRVLVARGVRASICVLRRPDFRTPSACAGPPMHTYTKLIRGVLKALPIPSLAVGLLLYFLTLALALVAAVARWVLGCVLGLFLGWVLPLVPSSSVCGYAFAIAPLVLSLATFVVPGQGRLWRKAVGAHRASAEQVEQLERIVDGFAALDPRAGMPTWCYVLDWPAPLAFVRGRALIVSTGLLECEGLVAVLAHELAHLISFDGVLTAAVSRLGLWGDLLAPSEEEQFRRELEWWIALPIEAVRWTVRIAGAKWVLSATNWLWAPFWRSRERVADEYAAALGQAAALADHLEDVEKPRSRPQRYRFFNPFDHDPPDLRIEYLRAYARGEL